MERKWRKIRESEGDRGRVGEKNKERWRRDGEKRGKEEKARQTW